MLKEEGLLEKGELIEVCREDLVARYVGHTALKTAAVVKIMEKHKDELVVILAGYSEEMEKMVALNPGLSSRVPHQVSFPDYSAEELYQIFKQHLGQGYHLDNEAVSLLKELLSKAPSIPARQGGNGRFVRNVMESK